MPDNKPPVISEASTAGAVQAYEDDFLRRHGDADRRLKLAYTLLKGFLWETIGMVFLVLGTLMITGNFTQAVSIGFGWPLLRGCMWLPYERAYQRLMKRVFKQQ